MEQEAYRCKKSEQPELYARSRDGVTFGRITVGTTHLFARQGLRLYAVPLEQVHRYWRRVEEAASHVGCCSTDFSMHKLGLQLSDGSRLLLPIGESLYRNEPERLIEALQTACPQAEPGLPQD